MNNVLIFKKIVGANFDGFFKGFLQNGFFATEIVEQDSSNFMGSLDIDSVFLPSFGL